MAWLVDTWTWDDLEDDLLEYLGLTEPVSTVVELKLKALLLSALRAGDGFMWNPWTETGEEGGTDITPPDDVKVGVFEWVRLQYTKLSTTGGGGAPVGYVVTSRKTGDLSENYGVAGASGAAGYDASNPSGFFPLELWRPYKVNGALVL